MSEKFHALLLAVKAIVEIDEVTVDAETDEVGTFIPLDKIEDLQIEKLDNVWERVTAMRPRTAATNYAGHGETKLRLGAATASAADGQRKPAKRRVS